MTKIQWTDETWNPVVGCSRVSDECLHCYAERLAWRLAAMGQAPYQAVVRKVGGEPRWNGNALFLPERLSIPLRWRKPRRVFVNSMSDLFHEGLTNEQIAAVFGVMAATPRHTYQVLTKRPERMVEWFRWLHKWISDPRERISRCWAYALDLGRLGDFVVWPGGRKWPLPNVWLCVSAGNQPAADERITALWNIPAVVRGVSLEPLLGPVDLRFCPGCGGYPGGRHGTGTVDFGDPQDPDTWEEAECGPRLIDILDWVVVGGESGPGARPCDVRWIESVVAQCAEAGVACFVKQLGSRPVRYDGSLGTVAMFNPPDSMVIRLHDPKGGDPAEWPEHLRVREYPEVGR